MWQKIQGPGNKESGRGVCELFFVASSSFCSVLEACAARVMARLGMGWLHSLRGFRGCGEGKREVAMRWDGMRLTETE